MTQEFVIKTPEQVLNAAFDQARTTLVCGKHNYAGGLYQQPRAGCKDCAQVQLMYILVRQKGDKQAALDELEALVHALCELADEGTLDYRSIPTEIHIEKDAIKD